jgi:hypothetical protein
LPRDLKSGDDSHFAQREHRNQPLITRVFLKSPDAGDRDVCLCGSRFVVLEGDSYRLREVATGRTILILLPTLNKLAMLLEKMGPTAGIRAFAPASHCHPGA